RVYSVCPKGDMRVVQYRVPSALLEITAQEFRFARRQFGSWTDLGNHGTIGRNCACRRHNEGTHLETNLTERQLKPVELLGLGDQNVAGTRYIMASQRLDVTEMVVARHRAKCLAMAGHKADRLGSLSKGTQRGVAEARGVGDVFHQHLPVTGLQ